MSNEETDDTLESILHDLEHPVVIEFAPLPLLTQEEIEKYIKNFEYKCLGIKNDKTKN